MTLIVFEPILTGHHETLLRQYLRLFCSMPIQVRLVCTRRGLFQGEDWFEKALGDNRLSVRVITERSAPHPSFPMTLRLLVSTLNDFRYWLGLRHEIHANCRLHPGTPVGLYFMYLGSKPFFPAVFWKWCIPVPWAALCGQAWRAPKKLRGTLPSRWWERMGMAGPRLERCRRIFYWRGEAGDFLARNVGKEKLEMVTDATDLRLPDGVPGWLTGLDRRASGQFMVCLVGAVQPRKGVRALLEAAQHLKAAPVLFVLAGRVHWEDFPECAAAELRRAAACGMEGNGNLVVIDRRIEDEADMNWIVKRSSVCYLAYVGFDGSSNVLSKAAAFKVPAIVTEKTVMAQVCEQHDLGWIVAEDSAPAVVCAVEEAMAASPERNLSRDFAGYAALQSESALEIQLAGMVQSLRAAADLLRA